jgi:two-component sensor histidine kinase
VLGGESLVLETIRRRRDGSLVQVAISGAPVRGPGNAVVGASTVHRDMTAWKQAEERMATMLRELTHRTKNLLAVVQAVERQSAATTDSKAEFHERFSGRLRAMALSHDALIAHDWRGSILAEMIRAQLAPFLGSARHRVQVEGPALRLNADASHNLALAIHELVTNATRFGALATPQGEVILRWQLAGDDGFEIRWEERGGPPVLPPTRRGFGCLVVERITPSTLDGAATLRFEPAGLIWELRIPARFVEPAGALSAQGEGILWADPSGSTRSQDSPAPPAFVTCSQAPPVPSTPALSPVSIRKRRPPYFSIISSFARCEPSAKPTAPGW